MGPEASRTYFVRASDVYLKSPRAIIFADEGAYRPDGDFSATIDKFRRAMSLLQGDQWLPVDIVEF
jgi:hypothetical protein